MDVDFPLLLSSNFVTFSGLVMIVRYIIEEDMEKPRAAAAQGTVDGKSPGWMESFWAKWKKVWADINLIQALLFLAAVAYIVFMALILQADFTQNSNNARRLFAFSLFMAYMSTMVERFYPKVCYLLFTFSYAFEGILFIFQMGCPLGLNVLICCLGFFCAALTLMTYLWGVRALRLYTFAFAASANGLLLVIFLRIETYSPHPDMACSILHLIPDAMVYFW